MKQAGIKTCMYSGQDRLSPELTQLLPYLDYLKLGAYKHKLGGLTNMTTNQRFYAIHDGKLIDRTSLFNGVEQIQDRKKDER